MIGVLSKGDTIVVKIGSSILTSSSGQLDMRRLQTITRQVSELKREGFAVVIVSSGAIACGMQKLHYERRPQSLGESCCAAAVGQAILMHDYGQFFRQDGYMTAQILLTSDGLHERKRYLNARNTILTLLEKGDIIPIVNENDAVATDEIKFGDNDKLSAQVAALIDARLLIILSDVDGLYDEKGVIINRVEEIDSCIEGFAGKTSKKTSTGGMVTKLQAAKIAAGAGIEMVIANGNEANVLQWIIKGEKKGTYFVPKKDKISGKKRWIAFSCKGCGRIIIDEGAKEAVLKGGKSLLSIGVIDAEGEFAFGDLVVICDAQHNEIARGLINYSNQELLKIKQVRTADIEKILGYKSYDEVIHRDNLVIVNR